MKNVNKWEQKTCIFKTQEQFEYDVAQIFDDETFVDCDYGNVSVSVNGYTIDNDELFEKLCKYYDVAEITSIHSDGCGEYGEEGIWIAYKDLSA